jgi:hypothetical protein
MARSLQISACSLLAMAVAGLAAPATPLPDELPALQAAVPAVPAEVGTNPTTRRLNSPGIEAAISSNLEEARTVKIAPSDSFQAPDLHPVDATETKSRFVPKMPAYLVVGSKLFVVPDAQLYTPVGTRKAEFATHPGLYIGNIFDLNTKAAYQIARDEEWRSAVADYWDLAHDIALGGDRREGRMIVEAVTDEDFAMRAAGEPGNATTVADRFKAGQVGDTRLLAGPENPLDIPVVRVDW